MFNTEYKLFCNLSFSCPANVAIVNSLLVCSHSWFPHVLNDRLDSEQAVFLVHLLYSFQNS